MPYFFPAGKIGRSRGKNPAAACTLQRRKMLRPYVYGGASPVGTPHGGHGSSEKYGFDCPDDSPDVKENVFLSGIFS
jgi:hypothetical protein